MPKTEGVNTTSGARLVEDLDLNPLVPDEKSMAVVVWRMQVDVHGTCSKENRAAVVVQTSVAGAIGGGARERVLTRLTLIRDFPIHKVP